MMSYVMPIPKVPSGNVWSVYVAASDIGSITSCNGQINVYIKGLPDNKDAVAHAKTHEKVHVTNWQDVYNNILMPFDKYLNSAKAADSTEQKSNSKLINIIQATARNVYKTIAGQFTRKANIFHASVRVEKGNFSITDKDSSCMWIKADLTT